MSSHSKNSSGCSATPSRDSNSYRTIFRTTGTPPGGGSTQRAKQASQMSPVVGHPDIRAISPELNGAGSMSYLVDFVTVSTTGLESSPVAPALAGLRANESRYFKN